MREKELPEGWEATSVKCIAELVRGVTYGKADAKDIEFSNSCLILRGGNIQDGKIIMSEDAVYVSNNLIRHNQKLKRGDVIIVSSTGSAKLIGKAAHSSTNERNISFGAFNTLLRPSQFINYKIFDYYFQTEYYRSEIRTLAGGININNIKREHLENLTFPLPPLAEQNRIVEKLDQLFASIEVIKAKLDVIPQLLNEFRQTVLTQAVTGKLTEVWREGKQLSKVRVKTQMNTDYDLHIIPEKWIHCIIKDLGVVKGGKRLPKGDELVSDNTGLPYIRARDLKQGTVLIDNLMYLKPETQKQIKNYIVNNGDLYITIVGAKIGDAGIIPIEMHGANLTENAAKITGLSEDVSNSYLSWWLRSLVCQVNIYKTIMSAAQGKLALTRINSLPVYLPPVQEQEEIVSRVTSLFAKADLIGKKYKVLKGQIDNLPQAILAKAFKGELVAQDPNDEPASVLLKRIKETQSLGKKVSKLTQVVA